jgi:hypothetical protein
VLTAHCSLLTPSLPHSVLFGRVQAWMELPVAEALAFALLRRLSERGPSSSWVGRDWGSGRAFLRLTRTSPMLVCRANPPVWSCRVERLPAMQLDGRAKWRGDGIRSLGFQPPGAAGCYWRAEAQSRYHIARVKGSSQEGSEGSEASHGPRLQMFVRTEVCVGSLVAWTPCVTCPGRALAVPLPSGLFL